MLQLEFSDCLFLDLLSDLQDLGATAVIDVGGCQVVQALVVAMVVVVIDEGAKLVGEVCGDVGADVRQNPRIRSGDAGAEKIRYYWS